MRASHVLLAVATLCSSLGCGILPPNAQTEWTTSGGPEETPAPLSDTFAISGADTAAAPAPAHFGARPVTLTSGEATLGIPLGADDGPGPMLVQPIGGGPPQLGTPLD